MTITINQAVWLQVLFVFLQTMSHAPEDMFDPMIMYTLRSMVGALQIAVTLIAAKSYPDGAKIPPPTTVDPTKEYSAVRAQDIAAQGKPTIVDKQ